MIWGKKDYHSWVPYTEKMTHHLLIQSALSAELYASTNCRLPCFESCIRVVVIMHDCTPPPPHIVVDMHHCCYTVWLDQYMFPLNLKIKMLKRHSHCFHLEQIDVEFPLGWRPLTPTSLPNPTASFQNVCLAEPNGVRDANSREFLHERPTCLASSKGADKAELAWVCPMALLVTWVPSDI